MKLTMLNDLWGFVAIKGIPLYFGQGPTAKEYFPGSDISHQLLWFFQISFWILQMCFIKWVTNGENWNQFSFWILQMCFIKWVTNGENLDVENSCFYLRASLWRSHFEGWRGHAPPWIFTSPWMIHGINLSVYNWFFLKYKLCFF